MKELLRVAKRAVIVRTLVGYKSYYIKKVFTKKDSAYFNVPEENPFEKNGAPKEFVNYNIYDELYVRALIKKYSRSARVTIEPDKDFNVKGLHKNKKDFHGRAAATEFLGGMQVAGYILLPWCFITIEK